MSAYVPREAIAKMFDAAPRDWWRFVREGLAGRVGWLRMGAS